jgi:hypothetical protein
MSTNNTIREGLVRLDQAVQSLASAEVELPEAGRNSISGNAIHGGKITLFRSTGITDNASKLVLLVDNDGITVDAVDTDTLVGDVNATGNLTVDGTLTADKVVTKQFLSDQKFTSNIEFVSESGSIDLVGLNWRKEGEKSKIFVWQDRTESFYSSDSINIHRDASIKIDNIDVLSADRLGPTIVKSELQTVGVLKNLHTTGDFNFDEGWVTWDSGLMRLSIGNELPNGQLSVSSNEAEFVIDPMFDTVKVGTYTTSDMEIVTDDTVRINISKTGKIVVNENIGVNTNPSSDADITTNGPIRIQNKKIAYDASIPTTGSHMKGDITYNTNPSVGNFVGWVCIESGNPGTWKPFGKIEEM